METSSTTGPAETVGSPFIEALNAFHARWDIAGRQDIQLWDPYAGPGVVSMGVARRDAPEESVVDVALHGDQVRLSEPASGEHLDLAAASRALRLPAFEVRTLLQVTVEALTYARDAYRLTDELHHGEGSVRFRERELDRLARSQGRDPAWLKDPHAQQAHLRHMEARRDAFAAQHPLGGVTASGLDDDYGLSLDIAVLAEQRDELAAAGLAGWLRLTTPPASRLVRALTLVPRLVHGVATYLQFSRNLARDLKTARERRRISRSLEAAHESLADAQELQAIRADVDDLRGQLQALLRSAATPTEHPQVPAPFTARPVTGSRLPHPAPTATAPSVRAAQPPQADPPGL